MVVCARAGIGRRSGVALRTLSVVCERFQVVGVTIGEPVATPIPGDPTSRSGDTAVRWKVALFGGSLGEGVGKLNVSPPSWISIRSPTKSSSSRSFGAVRGRSTLLRASADLARPKIDCLLSNLLFRLSFMASCGARAGAAECAVTCSGKGSSFLSGKGLSWRSRSSFTPLTLCDLDRLSNGILGTARSSAPMAGC
jgi:hypothetical protein